MLNDPLLNLYKIIRESKESEKEDILAGLKSIETNFKNANKPSTLLTTFDSGDVNVEDNVSVPDSALPVSTVYYQTPSGVPSIYYIVKDNGHFLWFFTDPVHRKLITDYYLGDKIGNEFKPIVDQYEELFDGLIHFPPYSGWEQATFGD